MKQTATNNYIIYQLSGRDRVYVAIPEEYEDVITDAVSIYGSLRYVPVEKTVRGIFLQKKNNVYYLDKDVQQNDITINQLRSKHL